MDTLVRLRSVSLFASLTPDNLARVAEIATRRLYRQGESLCEQEEFGQTLYVIDSGEAILLQTDLQGQQRFHGYLHEGDFVGDDALLFGDASGSCVEATTTLETICIRKQDFDLLLEEHPEIRRQMTLRPLIRERLNIRVFPWQEKDEPSLLLRKRHWFAFVRRLPLPLLTLTLLAIVAWLMSLLRVTMGVPATILFIGLLPSLMVLWLFADWQNDFYLVTAKRIVHREKSNLLYETLDEAPLAKIQNTTITHELLGKLLGFGSLKLETASMRGTMMLNYLPDPDGMEEVISRRAGYLSSRIRQGERQTIRQELLRQTRGIGADEGLSTPPVPSQQEQQKQGRHFLDNLLPSRPIFAMRYTRGNQVTWRKHWAFLIKHIYLSLPAFLVVTAFLVILLYRWPSTHGFALFLVFLLLWTASFFWLWWGVEDWRNDIYILTERAVIDVVKKPLFFSEDRKQAPLDMVQNVSLRIPNPIAALLNYGDVIIQTAGPAGDLNFWGVSHPADVQREIFRRIEAFTEARRHREMEQRNAELSTWFGVFYDEVYRRPRASETPASHVDRESPLPSGQNGR